MALSVATKFVAVGGVAGAIAATAITTTVLFASPNSQKTYQASTDLKSLRAEKIKCFLIPIKENAEGKLLICNNQSYYLQSSIDNKLTELEDLVTMSEGKITSKMVNKNPEVKQIWEITDPQWKTLSAGISLKIKNRQSNPNGKCSLEQASEGGTILSCEERMWYPATVKLIPLEVQESLFKDSRSES